MYNFTNEAFAVVVFVVGVFIAFRIQSKLKAGLVFLRSPRITSFLGSGNDAVNKSNLVAKQLIQDTKFELEEWLAFKTVERFTRPTEQHFRDVVEPTSKVVADRIMMKLHGESASDVLKAIGKECKIEFRINPYAPDELRKLFCAAPSSPNFFDEDFDFTAIGVPADMIGQAGNREIAKTASKEFKNTINFQGHPDGGFASDKEAEIYEAGDGSLQLTPRTTASQSLPPVKVEYDYRTCSQDYDYSITCEAVRSSPEDALLALADALQATTAITQLDVVLLSGHIPLSRWASIAAVVRVLQTQAHRNRQLEPGDSQGKA